PVTAPDVDGRAESSSADTIASLQAQNVAPGVGQRGSRCQSGRTRADYDHAQPVSQCHGQFPFSALNLVGRTFEARRSQERLESCQHTYGKAVTESVLG